ncbi:MAG: ATP-binding protein [Candidatus Dechloromonas phosphoritropha]
MIRRRPDLLALIVAVTGTLAVVAFLLGDLLLSREREIDLGTARTEHFGTMLAEHTARTYEALDILLREIASDLSSNHPEWPTWEPSRGWSYVAERHTRSLPQLRDLIIFGRDGEQRFISTYFPPPRVNVRDRPYFIALEQGKLTTSFGPFIGRISGRYTYALARRIQDAGGDFAGIVAAAIEPAYFSGHCWSNRLAEDFESVIINARGQVVASCRPTELSKQSPILGALAVDVLYGGRLRGWLPATGVARDNGLIASVSPVPDFADLRVLTVLPESSVLASWRGHLAQVGILAFIVILILLAGGLLVRRQVRDMHALTEDLAASRDQLEERVQAATAELSLQKDQAEQSNRAKSRFLAAASHDLRQPLHALALFATNLQRQIQAGNSNELPRLSRQISASTDMLRELFDSLLDISRLDVTEIGTEIHVFALNPILERLATSFRGVAVDRQQTLIFRPTGVWVESDPALLERILSNLIANALRYTAPGGRIFVGARRRGENMLIEVRDNGCGIASEHHDAIFDEFYQIGNRARQAQRGLGLGLSIVTRLARALGIAVKLRSAIGRGSTFGLLIKRAPPPAVARLSEPVPSGAAIHFVGNSSDLRACMEMAVNWRYKISHDPTGGSRAPEKSLRPSIIVTLASLAALVRATDPTGAPIIALDDGHDVPLPQDCHLLSLPVRPAKFRALLGQRQKAAPRSMP